MRRLEFCWFFSQCEMQEVVCAEGGAERKETPGREERPIRGEIEGAKLISISGRGMADGQDEFRKHVQFQSSSCTPPGVHLDNICKRRLMDVTPVG